MNEKEILSPYDIKKATISQFKKYLEVDDKKPKDYFNTGTRFGQILHARLRLQCSSLNEHLFKKNLRNDSLCVCGSIENTIHFLLHCPLYINFRNKYFNKLPCSLTEHNLLYGDDSLTSIENAYIFRQVQSYIIDSKRFDY